MKTIYLLESVNLENKSGVLKTKPESPKNAKWRTINVSISHLLAHLIENKKYRGLMLGDTFVGTKFSSEVNSREFSENPFNLVEFTPDEKSDIPHNFQLRMVNEARSIQVDIIDLYKNKTKHWKNRYRRPNAFVRYESVISNRLMKDVPNINVVKP